MAYPKEICVNLPYGQFVACVGGDEKRYPEIFMFLRRPDGIKIDLTAVSCDLDNNPEVIKAHLWSDAQSEEWKQSYSWASMSSKIWTRTKAIV